MAADRPWRNFYGRRHGKALRPGQQRHLEEMLPRLRVAGVEWEENPDRTPVDLAAVFGRSAPLWLEIGFGGGEHLLHLARTHPEVNCLGCEPFVNGVATLLPRIAEERIGSIRVHPGDARDLLDVLPSGAASRIYLLYPDPWPKKRHHRRRFVNPDNLDAVSRVLAPGGAFFVATDIPDYVRHTLVAVRGRRDLVWTAERPADWRMPWPGWLRTRYEAKAVREGRTPHYLVFRRTA